MEGDHMKRLRMQGNHINMLANSVLAAVLAVALTAGVVNKTPKLLDLRPAQADPVKTMRAVVYHKHGNASVLQVDLHHPRPVPRDGQVLVQVMASALNPIDFKNRRNAVPQFLIPLPKIPGCDIAGIVVEAVSSSKFNIGDRVAAMLPIYGSRWGAHAEFVAVDEAFLARVGNETDFVSAAAMPLAALTVVQNFRNLQGNTQGKKVLIHAGAGGVGSFAIQYAKRILGMSVATTSSIGKAELLQQLGADRVIDYRTEIFEDLLSDYDVCLDPMSWLYQQRTLNSDVLRKNGDIPSSDWGFQEHKENVGLRTSLVNLFNCKLRNLLRPGSAPKYDWVAVEPSGDILQFVLDLVDKGIIRPVIDQNFTFVDVVKAYEYLEQGHATGKVVLDHLND